MGPVNLYFIYTPGGLSAHFACEKQWFRVWGLEDEEPSWGCQVIGWFIYDVTRGTVEIASPLGTVGPFKGQGWASWGRVEEGLAPERLFPALGGSLPAPALVVFSLQELALGGRILISSGICAVTGFDPWD